MGRPDRKQTMFARGVSAVERLTGKSAPGYVCPLCLRSFDDISGLSREHAPPERVGGKVVALTCRDCNSHSGHSLDSHLVAEADLVDALRGKTARDWSATIAVSGVPARGGVQLGGEGLVFTGHPHRNDPATTAAQNEAWEKLGEGGEIKFQVEVRYRQHIVEVAWLRSAYVLAFAALGYRYITQPTLAIVREQIQCPETKVIERFYAVANVAIADKEMMIVTSPSEMEGLLMRFEDRLVWLPGLGSIDTYHLLGQLPAWPPGAIELKGKPLPWPETLELALDFE